MSRKFYRILMACTLFCWMTAGASGQLSSADLLRMGYEPVERAVGDVDPLRKSLKKPQIGLANPGQSQGQVLWRKKPNPANRNDPDAGRLFLFTRGQLVEYDRSRYTGTRRNGIVPLRPDNLIFHIGTPMSPNRVMKNKVNEAAIDGQIKRPELGNALLGVNGKVVETGEDSKQLQEQEAKHAAQETAYWQGYHRVREIHHQGVLDSMERVLSAMAGEAKKK